MHKECDWVRVSQGKPIRGRVGGVMAGAVKHRTQALVGAIDVLTFSSTFTKNTSMLKELALLAHSCTTVVLVVCYGSLCISVHVHSPNHFQYTNTYTVSIPSQDFLLLICAQIKCAAMSSELDSRSFKSLIGLGDR